MRRDNRADEPVDAPAMIRLRTERLDLRSLVPADATLLRALRAERDPRVPPHRRIAPDGTPTRGDLEAWIRAHDGTPSPGLLTMTPHGRRDPIGYVGLVPPASGHAAPELAYEILAAWHGHGYATEAARAVMAYAARAGHTRLTASVRAWNGASRRVLEKLGFVDSGQTAPDDGYGESLLALARLDPPAPPTRAVRVARRREI